MTVSTGETTGVRERKPKVHENATATDHVPSSSHGNAMMLLCMLIDGVGLAVVITFCLN
jgi:hypothetical protein